MSKKTRAEDRAARAAEAMGDDTLAERYTEDLLERHKGMFPFVRCNTLALRGRIASRRGDRGSV